MGLPPRAATEPRRYLWPLAWALVAAAAAYLRLWELGMQIVIDDEWHALNKLRESGFTDIALSFGHADHCIPLTLLYKLMSLTVGLDEWSLRVPPLVFGLAAVVVLPALFRPWTTRAQRLLYGALLAISPVLIYYSRNARPYALVVLLVPLALVCLFRWWREGRAAFGTAFVVSAALAAWLQPVTLAFTVMALGWAKLDALSSVMRARDWAPFRRFMLLGLAFVAVCVLLLGPPLVMDIGSITEKSGVHHVQPRTLGVAWDLAAGTGLAPVSLLVLALSGLGGWRLWRSHPDLMRFLIFTASLAALAVILSHAAWIRHGLTFLRYLLPLVPLVLLCVAVGLHELVSRITERLPGRVRRGADYALPLVTAALLYAAGPLPAEYSGINQFTGHMSYQFDYDHHRSLYVRALSPVRVPDFYRDIARESGPGWQVVEAPWRLESHFNPLYLYQRVHGLPLRVGFMEGLCAHGLYGEYASGERGLDFHWFVHLKTLLDDPPERTYLVMHRKPALPGMRRLPAMGPCIAAFRERYGRPWRDTGRAVVYRFGPDGRSRPESAVGAEP